MPPPGLRTPPSASGCANWRPRTRAGGCRYCSGASAGRACGTTTSAFDGSTGPKGSRCGGSGASACGDRGWCTRAPTLPNQRWSLDFVRDTLADGRVFRALTLVDDCTRECPAIEVGVSLLARAPVLPADPLGERGAAWQGDGREIAQRVVGVPGVSPI